MVSRVIDAICLPLEIPLRGRQEVAA